MSVLKIYQDVIDDVISSVRELFLEDGVDEQILQELRQSWEAKLIQSKAVDNQSEEKQAARKAGELTNGNGVSKSSQQASPQQQTSSSSKQVVGQVAPNNHVQTAQVLESKLVPIQITLPAQPGSDIGPRILTIAVPQSALQGNQLHRVLTGPVITATMNLPQNIAASLLQQHVNAAFNTQSTQASQSNNITTAASAATVMQSDGACDGPCKGAMKYNTSKISPVVICGDENCGNPQNAKFIISQTPTNSPLTLMKWSLTKPQVDGPGETSDDDDEASDEDEPSDDNDDDKEDDDQDLDDTGPEEEPLNSEDDVTDEDPADLFDTENVVVCQYDKITRSRNKWKFHLKDGIMNLNGEDFLFQKASGDAEW